MCVSAFPATRLRRLRRTDALRSLVRETRLDLDDFVMPYFAGPSTVLNAELPGMSRYSVEDLVAEAGELVALGTVVVEQARSTADRVDAYLTDEPGRSGDSAFDRDVLVEVEVERPPTDVTLVQ